MKKKLEPKDIRVNGETPRVLVKKIKFDRDNWQRHLRKIKDEKGIK